MGRMAPPARLKQEVAVTHVNLDTQPEVVRQFVLALSVSPEGVVLECAARPVPCVIPPPKPMNGPGPQIGESDGSRPPGEAYPEADFYEPVQWRWTQPGYKVRQALKRYSEGTPADHPDVTR
jgi:hypothetical protein